MQTDRAVNGGVAFADTVLVDRDGDHRAQVSAGIVDLTRRLAVCDEADMAIRCLEGGGVDLLLVDAALPNDGTFAVIDAAFRTRSSPLVIAMGGRADAGAHVFALAQVGIHAYLPKPIGPGQIRECLAGLASGLKPIRNLLRGYVGRFGLKDIQAYVRQVLVREALDRTGGSRRSAARVLGITRPAVQKFLREVGLE